MAKMKAVAITGVGKVEVVELNKPTVRPGSVLVKVEGCALCTMEQRTFSGIKKSSFPAISGHEYSGVVEEVGEGVTAFKPGDKVIGAFNYCGECYYCKRGASNQCINVMSAAKPFEYEGRIGGGGLAEYVVLSTRQTVKLADDADLIKCTVNEPVACCLHSIERARLRVGDDVVVIGGGIMGMLHCQLAKLSGCRVILAEPDPVRRALALDNGYAHHAYDPTAVNDVEYVKSLTDGRGADAVFNTTPIPTVAANAMKLAGKLGKVVMYSSQHPDEPQPVQLGVVHSMETELVGTVNPTDYDMFRAAKLLSTGMVDSSKLIEKVFPASQCMEAFEYACRPNTYRVVIKHEHNN